jgi:UDP-hydrolysing UDP-N-acetyl-D-glucosamine 2-epimerase
MSKRKLCVVTGTRAEYGLLYWLMKEIEQDKDLELQILATGMHLAPEFGLTFREIEHDGFRIDAKVEMLLSSDTPVGVAKSIGLGVIGMAEALERLKPDLLILLGDRYEILAAAQAAMTARVPIAHIHGGETTEGAMDEAIRHAVTKMAHLHFVAAEPYRKRVIQMGEHPERVFCYGAPGIDYIKKLNLMTKEQLEESLSFRLGALNFLVTYHPVTLQDSSEEAVVNLLRALDQFPEAHIIATKPNSDVGGRRIARKLEEYAAARPERVCLAASLGQVRYLSAIRHTDVVIGNSSSGIIEAPLFRKPTVNIGDRQKGRLAGESVIHCRETESDIVAAIRIALSPEFQKTLEKVESLYGDGGASLRIKETLKRISLDNLLNKSFYDISC